MESQHLDVQRTRDEYIVPGPNLVWSVDSHDKLSEYRIEIYGRINGHAWYLPWLTVEISNCTAVSIVQGYLDCISVLRQQPRFVRFDQGIKTILMAQAHLQLLQAYNPEIKVKDCYMYGTSTANQRIEAWWA